MKEAQRCILQQMSLLKPGLAARRDLKLRKQKKVSLLVSSGDPSLQTAPAPALSAWCPGEPGARRCPFPSRLCP